jgi:hypothetical protein
MILELSMALQLWDYLPLLAFFPIAALVAPVASSLIAPGLIAPTVAPLVASAAAGSIGPALAAAAPTVLPATASLAGAGASGALTGALGGPGSSAAAGGFGPIAGEAGGGIGGSILKGAPNTISQASTAFGPDETVNQVSSEVNALSAADGSGGPAAPAGILPEASALADPIEQIATTPGIADPAGSNIPTPGQIASVSGPVSSGIEPTSIGSGGGLGGAGFGEPVAGTNPSFGRPVGEAPLGNPSGPSSQQLAKAGIQLVKQAQAGLTSEEEQQSQAPGSQPTPRRSGPVVQGQGRADPTLQLLQALRQRQQPQSRGIRRGLT